MKRIISSIIVAVLLCLSQLVSAVPAKKGIVLYAQPDGSNVSIMVHGDEWFHYVTDDKGNILEENKSGFLVKSARTMSELQANMSRARARRDNFFQLQRQVSKVMTSGSPKIPVILVQFRDQSFSISDPVAAFTDLLTKQGYSANGGTGSVLDYYRDQSRGRFTPQFVVMDVVTLSRDMSYYGSNESNAGMALYEACQKLDATVDFSQFDNDHDGQIDMALMYYAGYNESEGGPTATIWPHQSYVHFSVSDPQSFDGVDLDRYFCTSELRGNSGTRMCSIGTTCHEFAHALGLPDMYDTNYDQYGDGEAGATYTYDLMCLGAHNNNGCTPPWMNAEELVMLGWMDGITELHGSGAFTLPSIASAQPVAYKTPTSSDGEYFLYESRPGTGWDTPLRGGLIVYHVDKSPDHEITWRTSLDKQNTKTAYDLWYDWQSSNAINCSGSHPCFYVVPAGDQANLNYSGSSLIFPGTADVTNYTPRDWSGSETGFIFTLISFNSADGSVSFRVADANECSVGGVVLDSAGNPLAGATVTISTSTALHPLVPMEAGELVLERDLQMLKAAGTTLGTVTTDATGSYSFILDIPGPYVISAEKSGYEDKIISVYIDGSVIRNFTLIRDGEELASDLYIYPDGCKWNDYGRSGTASWDLMGANMYPASMLGAYVGMQINSISFVVSGDENTTGTVDALIDFGNERKLVLRVDNPVINDWNTVDLRSENLIIPAGQDVFAGFALKSWTYAYPLASTPIKSSDRAAYLMLSYDLNSTGWLQWSRVLKVKLTVGNPDTGYNFIADPKNGSYSLGDRFDLVLNETAGDRRPDANGVKWYLNDEPANGSVTFNSAGIHTITARFRTMDGHQKVVELEVDVR